MVSEAVDMVMVKNEAIGHLIGIIAMVVYAVYGLVLG